MKSMARPNDSRCSRLRSFVGYWTRPRQRAYFRPVDSSNLPTDLLGNIDHIVTIRLVGVTEASGPCVSQRLYRIVGPARLRSPVIRPEQDFDFLDRG